MKALMGTVEVGVNTPGWTLRDQQGGRQFETRVKFPEAFAGRVQVSASLSGFDIERVANARLVVDATNPTGDGFTLRVRSWADTRIWLVAVSWVAIGE